MLYKLEIRSKLLLSGQNSVDAFLETNNACLDIGKAAMAAVLLQYESQEVLWNYNANNWMRYLFERIAPPHLTGSPKTKCRSLLLILTDPWIIFCSRRSRTPTKARARQTVPRY